MKVGGGCKDIHQCERDLQMQWSCLLATMKENPETISQLKTSSLTCSNLRPAKTGILDPKEFSKSNQNHIIMKHIRLCHEKKRTTQKNEIFKWAFDFVLQIFTETGIE